MTLSYEWTITPLMRVRGTPVVSSPSQLVPNRSVIVSSTIYMVLIHHDNSLGISQPMNNILKKISRILITLIIHATVSSHDGNMLFGSSEPSDPNGELIVYSCSVVAFVVKPLVNYYELQLH